MAVSNAGFGCDPSLVKRLVLLLVAAQLVVVVVASSQLGRRPSPADVAGQRVCGQIVTTPFHAVVLNGASGARLLADVRLMSSSTRWHAVARDMGSLRKLNFNQDRAPL